MAIARALVHNPRIVLADEPTGNLDSNNAARVLELLAALRTERRVTLVVVTHDPNVAAFADEIVFLKDGRVVDRFARPRGATRQDVAREIEVRHQWSARRGVE